MAGIGQGRRDFQLVADGAAGCCGIHAGNMKVLSVTSCVPCVVQLRNGVMQGAIGSNQAMKRE